jgi:small subunit ribosomal protein S18
MMMKKPERIRGCFYCENPKEVIDYKNERLLLRFVDERGKIVERRRTGMCAKHQKRITEAVKRARHIAILPFVMENVR